MSGSSTASPARTTSRRGRARVLARTRLDFWFDTVILAGYTVAYSLSWGTGRKLLACLLRVVVLVSPIDDAMRMDDLCM